MIYFKKVMRLCKFIIFIFVISQLILPTVSGSVGFSNSAISINDQLSRIIGDSEILETSVQKIEDQSKYDPMISLSYTPINQIGSIGDNKSIIDELNVNHPFEVNLTKALYDSTTSTGNYSIAAISGYTSLLKYNITSMTAIPDYLYIEDARSGNDDLADGSFLAIAQGFEITWDYAEFYGADIWFEIDGSGSLGTSALDLFLVKDNGSDPDINNASSILSNDINDPYTDINPVPSEDAGDLTFYDFEDVILEKGKYLVIANLSSVDATATENFAWVYKNGVPFLGNSCRYDATTLNWEERANADYTLMPYVLPLNSSQQPLTYNDPDLISLTDNALAINDVDQTIIGTGFHNLESSTSVQITFNNSYLFDSNFEGISSFQASNSTYYDYSIDWEVLWNIDTIEIGSYTNLQRFHKIITPKDWNNVTFNLLLNDSTLIPVLWDSDGYICELDILLSGSKFFEGSLKLSTSSPNYIYSSSLSYSVFNLGYWTQNGTHAIGHNGSSFSASVYVKERADKDILAGVFNLTVFDPEGNIIPQKISVPTNISFIDVTNYTLTSTSQYASGRYSVDSVFDPSIYGSDIEGYWTVSYIWQNGTEVGFFSKRITVNKPTVAEFEWETIPESDNWSSTPFEQISRINGEEIRIRAIYYNISDPFFSGLGNPISGASVSYQTSWGDDAGMNFIAPYYEDTILVSAVVENYSIDLLAEGSFLQSHSVQFSVKVLHTFAFNDIQHEEQLNHTDPLLIRFQLIDTSNSSSIVFPDEIYVFINNSLIPSESFSNETIGDETLITIQENELMENVSFYDINVTVSKRNFIDSFSNEQASFNFVVETLPISTRIQLVTSEIEVYHNNQTTISFRFIDTIHSEDIIGASIEISLDITEGEIVTHYEEDGVYHCVLRIFEPSVTSLNVFLNITKHGYETKINFLLASVNIKIPELGGIRPALIAVLIVAIVASLATVSFFVIRSRLQTRRQTQITQKSKVRDIYQATYMIKRLLIVHHETSSPVFEINMDERMVIDPSIISGVLQAISSIGQEMVGARTGIRKIEYYGFVITSASSGAYTVYLFSDTELVKELDDGIQRIANWFDVIFGYEGVNWQGSMDIFKNYHDNIMERIVDELYLWVLYPVEVTSKGLEDIAELDTVSQKIISFVDKKTKVTPAVIMDQLTEYEKETLLTKLFSLVDNEYLKKNISD